MWPPTLNASRVAMTSAGAGRRDSQDVELLRRSDANLDSLAAPAAERPGGILLGGVIKRMTALLA